MFVILLGILNSWFHGARDQNTICILLLASAKNFMNFDYSLFVFLRCLDS